MALDNKDIRVDVFTRGTPLYPVVRVTHIPSGVTAHCDSERSQYRSKNKALEKLEQLVKEGQ